MFNFSYYDDFLSTITLVSFYLFGQVFSLDVSVRDREGVPRLLKVMKLFILFVLNILFFILSLLKEILIGVTRFVLVADEF